MPDDLRSRRPPCEPRPASTASLREPELSPISQPPAELEDPLRRLPDGPA